MRYFGSSLTFYTTLEKKSRSMSFAVEKSYLFLKKASKILDFFCLAFYFPRRFKKWKTWLKAKDSIYWYNTEPLLEKIAKFSISRIVWKIRGEAEDYPNYEWYREFRCLFYQLVHYWHYLPSFFQRYLRSSSARNYPCRVMWNPGHGHVQDWKGKIQSSKQWSWVMGDPWHFSPLSKKNQNPCLLQ